jgi:hypothetical protein
MTLSGYNRAMHEQILTKISTCVREKRYRFTDHALEEADADDLSLNDIVDILNTGYIDSIYTEDLRGVRYVVRGTVNGAEVDVVCRFQNDGTLLIIITVYVVD